MTTSFLDRLAAYGIDAEFLKGLESELGTPFAFDRERHLFREGTPTDEIFFLDEGWLASRDQLQDGSAFYRAVYLPGDIVGLSELAWTDASSDLVALTGGRARRLPRSGLDRLLIRVPRLASLMLTMSVVQQTAVADRHAQALKSDGRGRLLYFLVDLAERQSVLGLRDWLELPITQSHIAAAVGLSQVHVNVLLRGLEEEGVIERDRSRLRFADLAAVRAETGYRARWTNVDFDWLTSFGALGSSDAA